MGLKKRPNPLQAKARLRAQLIMKVRCGLMTASEAAQLLGVSRKTYYKWEQRGLAALLDGLSDQEAGRPGKAENPAEAVLERQLTDLKRENELLEQKLELKDLVADFHIRSQKDRKKKNERIKRMVEKIESLKSQYGISIVSLVEMARLSLANYMRWKRRIRDGREPVQKPGAKKTQPIDLKELKQRIGDLTHGRKRSAGTGPLYQANRHGISRREFNEMVRDVRYHTNRLKAAALRQVIWLRPDLAWAMDGLEYDNCHIHNVQDMCSRYKFTPLTTHRHPCGEEIAGHLSRHLTRFGPPLFIKRDNGGNLNHWAVNDLLEENMVIPINSPIYTASYNGAIEHSQGELKVWLCRWKEPTDAPCENAVRVENAAHALNHRPRRSLSGKNACRSYFCDDRLRYTKRQRKEVYDWIRDLAVDISERSGKNEISPTAWRVSARKWMEKHRLIIIRKPEEVLPNFFLKNCHN